MKIYTIENEASKLNRHHVPCKNTHPIIFYQRITENYIYIPCQSIHIQCMSLEMSRCCVSRSLNLSTSRVGEPASTRASLCYSTILALYMQRVHYLTMSLQPVSFFSPSRVQLSNPAASSTQDFRCLAQRDTLGVLAHEDLKVGRRTPDLLATFSQSIRSHQASA